LILKLFLHISLWYCQTEPNQFLVLVLLLVKRLIEEAKKENIRLAIATTTSLSNVIVLLSQFLALDWFEVIAAGDIVPAKKPAPDIYNYVLKRMNLLPENCLVFEDSDNGLQAAIQAGIKTIVTVNNYTKEQDFNQAILVLSNLGESEKPFKIIRGNLSNNNYVDINSLRSHWYKNWNNGRDRILNLKVKRSLFRYLQLMLGFKLQNNLRKRDHIFIIIL